MCLGGSARPHVNASYEQMGVRLMADGSPIPFPLFPRQNHSVVPQNTGGWTQNGSFSLLGMGGSIMV